MSEMVERVAKAIETTMFAPHELPLDIELHNKYRLTASAAILAMREPTLNMVLAGCRKAKELRELADEYTAMIEEALR